MKWTDKNNEIGHTAGQILAVWLIGIIHQEYQRQNGTIYHTFYQMYRQDGL